MRVGVVNPLGSPQTIGVQTSCHSARGTGSATSKQPENGLLLKKVLFSRAVKNTGRGRSEENLFKY